jgi:dihydrofolate synthase/folylpolyglutamate synthase
VIDPLQYLFDLELFGIKFGLESIQAIVERLGHPERAFTSVHIAGTNGKGSVTAMIDAALRAAGHRAARYTSPHLVELAERFVIDGQPVRRQAMLDAIVDVRAAVDALLFERVLEVQPTFFEVTTAVAFELFRRATVDIAVLEVGLGGRLDSTNVVSPMATAITSIAFDHEKYLGSTLGQIATEKAGIIKPSVPVVVADLEHEAATVIEAVARARGATLIRAWDGVTVDVRTQTDGTTAIRLQTPTRAYDEVLLGLRGRHQVDNAVVAVRVLELLADRGISVPASAIRAGLERPSWPGRLELRRLTDGREVLLDAAHNPAGAAALASYLKDVAGGRLPLVFAAMRDKDVTSMLRALAPVVDRIIFTRASNRRSADPDALVATMRVVAPDLPTSIEPTPTAAVRAAWNWSPRIVVAGSIFLVGDVMKAIERVGAGPREQ